MTVNSSSSQLRSEIWVKVRVRASIGIRFKVRIGLGLSWGHVDCKLLGLILFVGGFRLPGLGTW